MHNWMVNTHEILYKHTNFNMLMEIMHKQQRQIVDELVRRRELEEKCRQYEEKIARMLECDGAPM